MVIDAESQTPWVEPPKSLSIAGVSWANPIRTALSSFGSGRVTYRTRTNNVDNLSEIDQADGKDYEERLRMQSRRDLILILCAYTAGALFGLF
jgi:hypothetical protein